MDDFFRPSNEGNEEYVTGNEGDNEEVGKGVNKQKKGVTGVIKSQLRSLFGSNERENLSDKLARIPRMDDDRDNDRTREVIGTQDKGKHQDNYSHHRSDPKTANQNRKQKRKKYDQYPSEQVSFHSQHSRRYPQDSSRSQRRRREEVEVEFFSSSNHANSSYRQEKMNRRNGNKRKGGKKRDLALVRPKRLPGKSDIGRSGSFKISLDELETPTKEGEGWFDSLKLEEKEESEKQEMKNVDNSSGQDFELLSFGDDEDHEKREFHPMRGLKKYPKASYLNSAIQILFSSYLLMKDEEKEQLKSCEFGRRISSFFNGEESQDDIYGLIGTLTGINESNANDSSNFMNKLFRVFEPQSITSFLFRNFVERKMQSSSSSDPESSKKVVYQRLKYILPVITFPQSNITSIQQGLNHVIKSHGYPNRTFEIFPKFILIECSVDGYVRESKATFVGFQKSEDYEVVSVCICSKAGSDNILYTAIIKGEKNEFYHCMDESIERVDSFRDIRCDYTKMILLKRIEKEEGKLVEKKEHEGRASEGRKEGRPGMDRDGAATSNQQEGRRKKEEENVIEKVKPRLVVTKRRDDTKIFLRQNGQPYASCFLVQACPNRRCRAILKYEGGIKVDDTKYVVCVHCNHVFCWLCRRDTPTCKSKSNDLDGSCKLQI